MTKSENNGWAEHSIYVRKELTRLSDGQDCIVQKINDLRVQVAMLKVKSGVWGAAGAMIPIAVLLFLQYVKS